MRWHFAAAPARDFYVPLILGRLLSRSHTVSHSPPLSGPHIGRPRPLATGPYSRVCSQSHRPVSGRSPPEHLRSRNSRSPHGTRECSSAPGAVSALSAAQPGGRTNPHPRTHSALSVPARPHGTLREEKLLIPPTMAIRGIQSGLRGMSTRSGSLPVCAITAIPTAPTFRAKLDRTLYLSYLRRNVKPDLYLRCYDYNLAPRPAATYQASLPSSGLRSLMITYDNP